MIAVIRADTLRLPLPSASVDAVVTDPPYGLEFMGKAWDSPNQFSSGAGTTSKPGIGDRATEWPSNQGWNQWRCRGCGHLSHGGSPCVCPVPDFARADNRWREFQAWTESWAAEALRVLKPGGHLLAFGGSRTAHRMICGVEDAGFGVQDTLAWLYGSGFPKSLNVSKAIDKAAGAEREILTQGTPVKRMIPGADQNFTGSWIKDNGRQFVPTTTAPATPEAEQWEGWGTALKPAYEPILLARKPLAGTVAANVLAHGVGALNINGCRVAVDGLRPGGSSAIGDTDTGRWPANVVLDEEAAARLDEQTGTLTSGANPTSRRSDKFRSVYSAFEGQSECVAVRGTDSGGPSRFFYTAKASTTDRGEGNDHPTVKPVKLMRWLIRLVTPKGGIVLDPFAGSGSTLVAAAIEGFTCIGIEREAPYIDIIRARLARPLQPVLF